MCAPSRVPLFATRGLKPARFLCPWDFPSKNTGLPFPPPGNLPDPGMETASPALAGVFSVFPLSHLGKPMFLKYLLVPNSALMISAKCRNLRKTKEPLDEGEAGERKH